MLSARDLVDEPQGEPTPEPHWPEPPAPDAFGGLAGDIVDVIEPHTEADRVALLAQLLVVVGNMVGRGPGFVAEGDFHATVLDVALVGDTAKGRKGSSWGQVRRLARLADEEWTRHRITSGLSSAEGLTWQVRDLVVKRVAVKEGKPPKPTGEYVDEVEDPGIDDKRLLVVEGELSQALRVMRREGNTLSVALRNLWDHGTQRALTKHSPSQTTDAHVSVIGHISRDELRRELTVTDAANGFANRFLFVCSRRSKVLPDGSTLCDDELRQPAALLRAMVDHARGTDAMVRDEDARALWHAVYERLSEGRPGLLGAVTARAEAQVMRLAVVYAVLAGSSKVKVEHLKAALALWDYALRSAAYVFGGSLGDPVADEILRALRRAGADGMTRTAIGTLLGRHKSLERTNVALDGLAHASLAYSALEHTGGRPREVWRATPPGHGVQR